MHERSFCKHLAQHCQYLSPCLRIDRSQSLDQAGFIHRPQLVQHDLAYLALKLAGDPARIIPALRGHWSHDQRGNVRVHLVRRDDQARAGFSDFTPHCWIQVDQVHFKSPDYHAHSSSSHKVGRYSVSSRSSPSCAMLANCASHPWRGRWAERMINWSSWTVISTSSSRPACSSSARGMRMPRELPIFTTFERIVFAMPAPPS